MWLVGLGWVQTGKSDHIAAAAAYQAWSEADAVGRGREFCEEVRKHARTVTLL